MSEPLIGHSIDITKPIHQVCWYCDNDVPCNCVAQSSRDGFIKPTALATSPEPEKVSAGGNIRTHEGKKYLRLIHPADGEGEPVWVDVYSVLEAFGVACPARAHALKKLLCCGSRGKGGELADLKGVLAAVNRAVDLQQVREWSKLTSPTRTDLQD